MKTAEERAWDLVEALAAISDAAPEKLNTVARRKAVQEAFREHEADVRADERAKALTALHEYRASIAAISSTWWTSDEVLEDLNKLIAEIGGSIT